MSRVDAEFDVYCRHAVDDAKIRSVQTKVKPGSVFLRQIVYDAAIVAALTSTTSTIALVAINVLNTSSVHGHHTGCQ